MKRRLLFLSLLLCCLIVVGCGKNVKVSGKVSFSDGTPLDVGKVCFSDGTIMAYGKIDTNGTYTMGMTKDGEGIPPGTYKVSIVDAKKPDSKYMVKSEEGDYPLDVTLIHLKYSNPNTSELECVVNGATTYDIPVEAPPSDYRPTIPGAD